MSRLLVDGLEIGSAVIEMTNRVNPAPIEMASALESSQFVLPSFETQFNVDAAAYDRLIYGTYFTVEVTEDRNPWHRKVDSRRGRLKRLRDGMSWSFRKWALRRHLIELVKVTIPNCRLNGVDDRDVC